MLYVDGVLKTLPYTLLDSARDGMQFFAGASFKGVDR